MNPILRALAGKYREHLKPFEGHTQEVLDLLVMHPHIASIVNSRIVEVDGNANGNYARWENGLQLCWRYIDGFFGDLVSEYFESMGSPTDWGTEFYRASNVFEMPAEFVGAAAEIVAGGRMQTNGHWVRVSGRRWDAVYMVRGGNFSDTTNVAIHLVAVGMWKE